MARVTVEDCVDKVPNRFELVLLATHRAREINKGSHITIEAENDKNPVIALRAITEKTIAPSDMREGLIHSIQGNVEGILALDDRRWRELQDVSLSPRLQGSNKSPATNVDQCPRFDEAIASQHAEVGT